MPTRMHSSRMRTGHSLTVCCSLPPGGGSAWSWGGCLPGPRGGLPGPGGGFSLPGVLLGPGGVLPAGGMSAWSGGALLGPRGFSLLGGVYLVRGTLLGPRGFSLLGGCLSGPGGLSLVRGGSPCLGGSPETPPVNRITHTCKNITLATTSLRLVNIVREKW